MLVSPLLYTTYAKDVVNAAGTKQTVKLTPKLWSRAYEQEGINAGGSAPGIMVYDDFLNFGGAVATNVGTKISQGGSYKTYESTSATCTQIATETGGVIRLSTPATDNLTVAIQGGYSTGVLGAITKTESSGKLTIFEARVRPMQVADDESAFFVGLAEEAQAVIGFIEDNTGAVVNCDYIGFQTVNVNSGTAGLNAKLKFSYKKSGQTAQTVLTYGTDLVANTWYNLGFIFDPEAPAAKRITVWIDGVEQTTYVTGDNMAAATFPSGEEVHFISAIKNGSAAAGELDIDCWAFYQAG